MAFGLSLGLSGLESGNGFEITLGASGLGGSTLLVGEGLSGLVSSFFATEVGFGGVKGSS